MKISCTQNGLSVIMTAEEMDNHGIDKDARYTAFCSNDSAYLIINNDDYAVRKGIKCVLKGKKYTFRFALSKVNGLPANYTIKNAINVSRLYGLSDGLAVQLPVDPHVSLARDYEQHVKNMRNHETPDHKMTPEQIAEYGDKHKRNSTAGLIKLSALVFCIIALTAIASLIYYGV